MCFFNDTVPDMLRATLAALRFEWRYGSFADVWFRGRGMVSTWYQSLGTKLPDKTFKKRMAACRECPVFHKPLGTCGNALKPKWYIEGVVAEGCFCHMKTKAKLAAATCWLDDHSGVRVNWPE